MEFAFLALYAGLLAAAAASDLKTMLIPNWVSAALALAFLPAAAAAGLSPGLVGAHLAAGALGLLVCAGLFYLHVFGGGDAKLIAATLVWTGFSGAADFLMATAIAGGGLALALIVLRRLRPAVAAPWAQRLMSPAEGAPYAVAIALGGWAAIPSSPALAPAFAALAL
jgi:prepilin peptidase CpaA